MFNKNILIVDTEFTGLDFFKHDLIQIAGILLDKKTLREIKRFSTYIKPKNWRSRDPEAMEVNQISYDDLKNAPDLKSALLKFQKYFGINAVLAPYGTILDTAFLRVAYKSCELKYPYDHHVLDVWPLLYVMMAKKGRLINRKKFTGFTLENAAEYLKVKIPDTRHNALSDCILQAEILRKVIKHLGK